MKIITLLRAMLPGSDSRKIDPELEHFALRTASCYTTIAACTCGVGGWALMLLSAIVPALFWPAVLALVFAGLLGWKVARIWRRLRTLDADIR